MKNSLLIVGCSKTKSTAPEPMPAIERYNGPTYLILRRAKRKCYWPKGLVVLILSAEHGLIEAHTPILYYDRLMTSDRVTELQSGVVKVVEANLARLAPAHIMVNLGKTYLPALPKMPADTRFATGFIGHRGAQVKAWLKEICQLEG